MSGGADGTCSDGDAFQLRMEIVDLRKKLKLLDGGGEKSELLSLLQERDDELSLKNQQLAALNAKFRQITDGLQTIESERQADKAAYVQLEKDKGRVEKHLAMREKEIETIAQRCAGLEEKIQGSVPLRVAHNNLLKEKEDLERQMEAAQQKLLSLEPIQDELAASRAETEDALVKLKKAEDDAEAESDRLRADVSILQDEKAAYQTKIVELEASISKISAERDADRKDHRDATTALRNDLQKSRGGDRGRHQADAGVWLPNCHHEAEPRRCHGTVRDGAPEGDGGHSPPIDRGKGRPPVYHWHSGGGPGQHQGQGHRAHG